VTAPDHALSPAAHATPAPVRPRASVIIVREQDALLVVELALEDAQAGIGQVPGVAPAEQFLALRVDDRPAALLGGQLPRRGRRVRILARFHPVKPLTVTPGLLVQVGAQRGQGRARDLPVRP